MRLPTLLLLLSFVCLPVALTACCSRPALIGVPVSTCTSDSRGCASNELRSAAKQGDAKAQFQLALCFRDTAKVVKWVRRAAEQGHPAAQATLGYAYAGGRYKDVPQDSVQAHIWLSLASESDQWSEFGFVKEFWPGFVTIWLPE